LGSFKVKIYEEDYDGYLINLNDKDDNLVSSLDIMSVTPHGAGSQLIEFLSTELPSISSSPSVLDNSKIIRKRLRNKSINFLKKLIESLK